MKQRFLEISLFLSLFVCIISCMSFENNCEDIRQNILRLHIIASSDSEEDQTLKLQVRDALLQQGKEIFTQNDSLATAESKIRENLDLLTQTAQNTVYSLGYTYPVKVEIKESYFPTREYENATLPAGYYNALKVIIGEGSGQNWWCVMFPPMCLPAASDSEAQLSDVLNEKEFDIVTNESRYEVRFWIVEKYQELMSKLKDEKIHLQSKQKQSA